MNTQTPPPTEYKQIRLSLKDRIFIHDVMKPVIKDVGDGTVEYDPGWSDERVCEVVRPTAPDATVGHVQYVRLEMFGKLRQRRMVTTATLAERVEKLEKRVAELEDAYLKK